MIGPFDLLVDVPCMLFGMVIGALAVAIAVLISAGQPSAAEDRNSLIEILKGFDVPDSTAVNILERGLNRWAQWRAKIRPFLWRWAMDWPEYSPTSDEEFLTHYKKFIPAPAPSFAPSYIPDDLSSEQSPSGDQELHDAFPLPSEPPEPKLSNTPESG